VNTGGIDGIPVALVQGRRDGIATKQEAEDTIAVIDGPSELIIIDKANHYGITDVNNPPGAIPDSLKSENISQEEFIQQIALASGQFLFEALTEGE
jgi:pimeloyl-ACP methyl ester carboxylesterase